MDTLETVLDGIQEQYAAGQLGCCDEELIEQLQTLGSLSTEQQRVAVVASRQWQPAVDVFERMSKHGINVVRERCTVVGDHACRKGDRKMEANDGRSLKPEVEVKHIL